MTPRDPTPPLTRRLRACCFRYGCPIDWVSLAIGPHSLARSSKRTIGHWQPLSYNTLASTSFKWKILLCPYRSIAVRFQALLTSLFRVLFSFRSLYYCAIGLEICLALEEGVPRIPARYPTHGTQDQSHVLLVSCTGLSPSLAPRSRGVTFASVGLKDSSYNTTSPPHSWGGFGLGFAVFTRRYLQHLVLISFPAPTQMFQLRAFPTRRVWSSKILDKSSH